MLNDLLGGLDRRAAQYSGRAKARIFAQFSAWELPHLTAWAQVARSAQILDFLDPRPARGAGPVQGVPVHLSDITAAMVVKVVFIVSPPFSVTSVTVAMIASYRLRF